ncbi:MAG: TetR/AcrR family transcriptional regulator [bacterium]|nr:TetR/AcrR family transcriptional regulator [bacterium]
MKDEKSARPDRRRARTRKMLADALIALTLERGYDPITIQDIADRADLSRATFYLHYDDKDDLLINCLKDMYDAFMADKPGFTTADLRRDGHPPSLVAFQQAEEFRDLYRVLQRASTAHALNASIKAYLAGQIRKQFTDYAAAAGIGSFHLPFDVLIEHMASSLIGLILWWLENDTPYTALDMARLYHTMNVDAWTQTLGLPPHDAPVPSVNGGRGGGALNP